MTASSFSTISSALTTGTIIAIVVGSISGLAVLIGTIVAIVCICKHLNQPRNAATRGMIIQPAQAYPYPQPWTNQYPPNTMNVGNYPPAYQTITAPYTVPMPMYGKPVGT